MLATAPVPGYEGKYLATVEGQVWTTQYQRYLKPDKQNRVTLSLNASVATMAVDELVLAAFGRAIPADLRIIHIDGDARNNAFSNLDFDLHRCKRGHAFTTENTYFNPSRPGVKHCVQCRDAHHTIRVAKRRQAKAAL